MFSSPSFSWTNWTILGEDNITQKYIHLDRKSQRNGIMEHELRYIRADMPFTHKLQKKIMETAQM